MKVEATEQRRPTGDTRLVIAIGLDERTLESRVREREAAGKEERREKRERRYEEVGEGAIKVRDVNALPRHLGRE